MMGRRVIGGVLVVGFVQTILPVLRSRPAMAPPPFVVCRDNDERFVDCRGGAVTLMDHIIRDFLLPEDFSIEREGGCKQCVTVGEVDVELFAITGDGGKTRQSLSCFSTSPLIDERQFATVVCRWIAQSRRLIADFGPSSQVAR